MVLQAIELLPEIFEGARQPVVQRFYENLAYKFLGKFVAEIVHQYLYLVHNNLKVEINAGLWMHTAHCLEEVLDDILIVCEYVRVRVGYNFLYH